MTAPPWRPYLEAMTKIQWEVAERLAAEFGVTPPAFKQWRERNVIPHKWRWRLVKHAPDTFTFEQFEAHDKRRKAVRTD